jgi:transcriptional regulator with XRE-family HTH domain
MDITVGGRVREQRLAKDLTQKQLADLAGLHHTTISDLETGITVPGLSTLVKIAKALGVPLSALLVDQES